MGIVGSIIAILAVLLFFYFVYRFMAGSIQNQIEKAVDKTATPEVQAKQREQAELEILQAMSRATSLPFNNTF